MSITAGSVDGVKPKPGATADTRSANSAAAPNPAASCGEGATLASGNVSGPSGKHSLGKQPQRGAARDQHSGARARRDHVRDQRARLEQVLEVVQHHQQLVVAQDGDQRSGRIRSRLLDPERPQHLRLAPRQDP
jgi:hypothetical protein